MPYISLKPGQCVEFSQAGRVRQARIISKTQSADDEYEARIGKGEHEQRFIISSSNYLRTIAA